MVVVKKDGVFLSHDFLSLDLCFIIMIYRSYDAAESALSCYVVIIKKRSDFEGLE